MTDRNGTRARRAAEGVCVDCGGERAPTSKQCCRRCLLLRNPNRPGRVRAGLCRECGAPRAHNSVSRCRKCLDRKRVHQAKTAERKAAECAIPNPCRVCWKAERAAHSSMKCQPCLEQSREAVRKSRANGAIGTRSEK